MKTNLQETNFGSWGHEPRRQYWFGSKNDIEFSIYCCTKRGGNIFSDDAGCKPDCLVQLYRIWGRTTIIYLSDSANGYE